jgi:hypothetical protein
MKTLKLMALAALVCCGSNMLAINQSDINNLRAQVDSLLILRKNGQVSPANAEAQAKRLQQLITDILYTEGENLTNAQMHELIKIQALTADII